MRIEKLSLLHFKNYRNANFEFGEDLNCLFGENGSGKTNLMDAIYFLALTKSAFHNQDQLSITHDEDFFILDGVFSGGERRSKIRCMVQRNQKKVLLADGKAYERLNDHIGRFPVVLVLPGDTNLVSEGSEVRRKFFDGVLSQMDPSYLADLMHYSRYLHQRNAVLKIMAESGRTDHLMLDTYDEPLISLCKRLGSRRREFIASFEELFQKYYRFLSQGKERVEINYETEVLDADFEEKYLRQRTTDLQAQRTTKGLHKDEYAFYFDGVPVKKFASQGQLKSFALALRLAQFELMERARETKPILLLDDVFDKLDDLRIGQLLDLIQNGTFGQVFISDARPERSTQLISHLRCGKKIFDINKGQ